MIKGGDKMKIFISQPMGGLSEAAINTKRTIVISKLKDAYGEDIEILDTNFDFPGKNALYYLAKSLEYLSTADLAYFVDGWENYRGCKIERICCKEYNIPIVDEFNNC